MIIRFVKQYCNTFTNQLLVLGSSIKTALTWSRTDVNWTKTDITWDTTEY